MEEKAKMTHHLTSAMVVSFSAVDLERFLLTKCRQDEVCQASKNEDVYEPYQAVCSGNDTLEPMDPRSSHEEQVVGGGAQSPPPPLGEEYRPGMRNISISDRSQCLSRLCFWECREH